MKHVIDISRRDFLKTAGLATAAMFSGCATMTRITRRQPNIIFILTDDLGYGDLGCYGQRQIKTPNLDWMAAEGMRFTQHYAGSTVCAPSRCVLMTGLHTGHCRIRANARVPLHSEDLTVAEMLKQAGYATGLIGKWGLGEADSTGIPNRKGFDYFYGYLNQRAAHNYYPDRLWENETEVRLPNEVQPMDDGEPGGVSTNKLVYSHDLFIEKTMHFVETQKDKPFFLYLALTIPHANNQAGNEGMEVPDLGIYKDKDWPAMQKAYAAMVSRMDGDIGKLFARLKTLGIDENTVVMFSSDNGPHAEGGNDPDFFDSNGPLRGIKRDLYEGGIRVPLIVRWPGKIKPNNQSDHISGFQDFMPTCAQIAGAKLPEKMDGISCLPTLLGQDKKQRQHPYLYWEFYEEGGKQAMRMGKWKGIRLTARQTPGGPLELYDLSQDLGEENDVAGQNEDIVKKMSALMRDSHTPSEEFPF